MKGNGCTCAESKRPIADRAWEVVDYRCNYSAFSGYQRTYSDYSALTCNSCGARWRTKAKYVDELMFKPNPAQEARDAR